MFDAPWDFFAEDYHATVRRFSEGVARVRASGLAIEEGSLPLSCHGPAGEVLAIHHAWIGPKGAPRVLVHTAGIHGPEAFAGCAIQLALLKKLEEKKLKIPDGTAIAMVHVVNPYGMIWRRRANESNVDLNRNWLPEGTPYQGAHPLYRQLDDFMNPRTGARLSQLAFRAAMVKRIVTIGMPGMKQAFAGGQYEFPKGIFFGGSQLEEGPRELLKWLGPQLEGSREGFIIDVHTGLGPYGVDILLVLESGNTPRFEALKRTFGDHVTSLDPKAGEAYKASGSLIEGISARFPKIRWTAMGQEFGTYSSLKGLMLLRAENAFTNWGDSKKPDAWRHPTRQATLDFMRPKSKPWRWKVVRRGEALFDQALDWIQRESGSPPRN
jgi:hypothetical protein